MDSLFLLDEGARATFLQHIVQSFGCTYICLWSYLPQPSNCLIFLGGFYNEGNINQPSSSSGSVARRLFDEYRQSVFSVENNRIPGLAFKNSLPFMELRELDLQCLASVDSQLLFYQEARIKSAIFMGCMAGEIELGTANDTQVSPVNLEMEMRSLFPDDFSRQAPILRELPHPTDQNQPSSSSSSLRSLSMDSSERSPFLFNIPSTSYVPEPPKEAPIEQALRPISSSISPLHQAMQAFSQIRNVPLPTPEAEDAAMTRAILAVLSSPSSSSSPHQPQQNVPPNYPVSRNPSAFKRYRSFLAPSTPMTARTRRQNMLKRSITFFKTLNLAQNQEQVRGSRPPIPTSTQLHHMIAERKRREKLNESFQVLRSLLPPGTKKDKASVLSGTVEFLTSLKDQVLELSRRNQILEAQILPTRQAIEELSVSSNERLDVQITHVAESTSESRIVDLQVIVRGECNNLDLVTRILEFLKEVKNVSLMSMEADSQVVESNSINRVILRLKIEGGEWDESAFQEAVRRVVADLPQ